MADPKGESRPERMGSKAAPDLPSDPNASAEDQDVVSGSTGLTGGAEATGPGADAGVTSSSRATATGANLGETEALDEDGAMGGRGT